MIFDVRGKWYPTVYFLWKFPNLAHAFTTHPQVMQYLSSGADLMLPGVCTPPHNTGLQKYGSLNENDLCYVNLSNNLAAVAVGVAAQSSRYMVLANGRGKCVNVLHFYGDKLCGIEGQSNLPIPNMGKPEWLVLKSFEDDFPALGERIKPDPNVDVEEPEITIELTGALCDTNQEDNIQSPEEPESDVADAKEEVDTVESMDERLQYCFLVAVKYSKTLTLPCLTSNFFKLHMLPACPEDKTLDIKKSSYKKLKPFLEKMSQVSNKACSIKSHFLFCL